MLGLVVNTASTPLEASTSVLTPSDIDNHFTYAAQQRLDGYAEAIHHAIRRKATFDKKVLKSKAGVVIFTKGQLVQTYRSDLMNTLSTDRKLQPSWSGPYRIYERLLNSYILEELDGTLKAGEFSARRLRAFIPREGTELAEEQRAIEERLTREGGEIEGERTPTNLEESGSFEDEERTPLDDINNPDDSREMDVEQEDEGSNIADRCGWSTRTSPKGGGRMD